MNPRYAHLPPPPVSYTQVHSRAALRPSVGSMTPAVKTHAVYAWHHRDVAGDEQVEMIGLTDYLWRAVQAHCLHASHTLHLNLRGAWKAVGTVSENDFNQAQVEMGDHSGHRIVVQQAEWPDFVEDLCVKLMPGWWVPSWQPLTGLGGGLPATWLSVEREITALRPGRCLRVSDSLLALPQGGHDLWEAVSGRQPMDAILEQIVGAAYELTLRRRQHGFLRQPDWIVRRLKQPLTSDHTRAYLSPDRRAGWHQDPETGLWHRDQ